MPLDPLPTTALRTPCDPDSLGFGTTTDLEPVEGIVGQDRAVEAVEFAIAMRPDGYNLFVQGPEGSGRTTLIRDALGHAAAGAPAADDWCYVHRFGDPQRPRALRLPAGRGRPFRDAMERLVLELRRALPAAFESESYRVRREALEGDLRARRDETLEAFDQRARTAGVALIRTPMGLGLAMTDGEAVLEPAAFKALPPDEQARRRAELERLEGDLQVIVRHLPTLEQEGRDQLAALHREVVRATVGPAVAAVRESVADLPDVVAHLGEVEADAVAHAEEFITASMSGDPTPAAMRAVATEEAVSLRRYVVNLVVDHGGETGAPVVHEDHPTYANLVGRVEHVSQLGTMATNFTLIRAGALHRAAGGYLILEARKVLVEPYAWDGLKRALRAGEIRIESIARALTLVDTVSLEPDPIPLRVKVALIGERRLFDVLTALDPEFPELFRVAADFDDAVARSPEADRLFARVMATMSRSVGGRPLAAAAVAALIEHQARVAGDAMRLSTGMRALADLVGEADHWAGLAGRERVEVADVEAALEARRKRLGRRRGLLLDAIRDGAFLIETDGTAVGQVNGLSVHQLGDEAFGWPSRITARVRVGGGEVVDIEREVDLGGPIHSKGVLILAGYLGGRYGAERPLSIRASIGFEQSYGGVDGDSASLAELCALLSAIGEVPLRQSIAVTGSVDQWGRVQPVGGVNEKVEGFYDVCDVRGTLGEQGVVLPAANARNLMLRPAIVDAAGEGRFRLWAVETLDEALELLTGRRASAVHAAVEARLAAFARASRPDAGTHRAASRSKAKDRRGR
jgi:predicted ATP-dependent protease